MQDMDTAVQLGQWNPFLAWTPKEEVLFLPKLENELLLRLRHCGVVRARAGVQWPATGSWQQQLRVITEADPLTTTQEAAKERNVNHSTVIWYLKQTGKVKKFSMWVPHKLTAVHKKIIILRCHLLVFYATMINYFSIRFWRATKSGLCTATGNGQLSGWTEKLLWSTSQSQICTKKKKKKKDMVTLWWSAAALIHYSFLSPSETITSEKYAQQIAEMHQKLQCLQLALVNRKGPILLHDNARLHVAQPTFQKLNELG